ncbi:MAG: esterase-like activity of phytase family protein, partial [Bacteroidota bacterium]|nr:esterase-like activity of phytase family protein [Bacteroidota bacterium]
MRTVIFFSFFSVVIITISCSSSRKLLANGSAIHLKFLSEYDVPYNKDFQNTTIGGLSGIDYVPAKNTYYLISDDRSEHNPARFYEAKININQNKIDSIVFSGVTFLKNSAGTTYPNSQGDPYHTPDPEALRYNPDKNTFVWSSEGERIIKPGQVVLENPSVTEINLNGTFIDTFELPPQVHMKQTESGPRRNGVFEGLTFADNYKSLFVNVEEPLYNDGSRAGLNDSSGIIRILKFDMATKKPVAQYAYIIDPVAHAPVPSNAFEINGIPDILYVGNNKMLVIERSFSTGRMACTIKVFLADISSAENIAGIPSLKNKQGIKFVSKKLLLNMDNLGIYIDNIEGVTFGPT